MIRVSDRRPGRLVVFEGPDGVGKSTLHRATEDALSSLGEPVRAISFPGSLPGTLGELVYRIHHQPEEFGVDVLDPLARQLLHVAAHVDAIEHAIKPALASGESVLLDRFWWSTWVYGVVDGVPRSRMDALVHLEEAVWGDVLPVMTFLITRAEPLIKEHDSRRHQELSKAYEEISSRALHPVARIHNDETVYDAVQQILGRLNP